MSNRNNKVYKNFNRDQLEVHKKYVPQYKVMGLDPEEIKSAVVPPTTQHAIPTNSKINKPTIRQPYAKIIPSPVGRGRGLVPNVGNNMEHTWASVDGDIIDDLSDDNIIDSSKEMIDNNEFVTNDALGIHSEYDSNSYDQTIESKKSFMTKSDLQNVIEKSDLSTIASSCKIKDDEYILLVNGNVLDIGSFDFIQDQVKNLVFGEHDICDVGPVPVDDLLILKRVKLKIGVFLE